MEKQRLVLFIVLSVALLVVNLAVQSHFRAKQEAEMLAQKQAEEKAGGNKDADKKDDDKAGKKEGDAAKGEAEAPNNADNGKPGEAKPGEAKPAENAVAAADADDEPESPPQWFTLGSADPGDKNPYRLLATITNAGAAVERIELSSARYRDLETRSGYLGHLIFEDTPQGVKINVVGEGTPAAVAGLQPGDVLTAVNKQAVADVDALRRSVAELRPDDKAELDFLRGGQTKTASVTLGRQPLEVLRPEVLAKGTEIPTTNIVQGSGNHDPFSFLLTLWRNDDKRLPADAAVDDELAGVKLRQFRWNGKQVDKDTVEFSRNSKALGLKIIKRYKIAKQGDDGDKPAYHLTLEIEIQNTGDKQKKIAYQLDGPTGLPTEGWWYATRISREWGGAGIRDVAMLLQDKEPALISPMKTAEGKVDPREEDVGSLLIYAGVDAQYFASALLPVPLKDRQPWLAQIKPIQVGGMPADPKYKTLCDVSCRLVSLTQTLDPGAEPLKHTYTIFAGPKQPNLLAQYPLAGDPTNNLGELIYYGWPIWAMVARPMTQILQLFYSIVGNYGIAIVMLTVLVRGCMFPLSRKQALGAQKMQELKPEMDRINEKYKSKPEEKTRAMQELWRKHNYNPMSGCMVAFLQLPIFIGLYRSLMINVELRQAPLLGDAVHWCSNLAAPDMLARWADWAWMPSFLTNYKGFMSLGPYLNILPIFTVALFIIQQQMFMPPATDEQTQMQQKMMKYMMIFIGYMFYTVPAGLCLYIISSSIWGITEKKLLPKPRPKNTATATASNARLMGLDDGNGAASRRDRKKQRGGK